MMQLGCFWRKSENTSDQFNMHVKLVGKELRHTSVLLAGMTQLMNENQLT